MGKKSRRCRGGTAPTTPLAPARLPADVHPHFSTEFRAISAPKALLESVPARALLAAVEDGILLSWQVGRRGTFIASRFATTHGAEDMLTSPVPNDENYEMLCSAHLDRLIAMLREAGLIADAADGVGFVWT